MSKRAITTLLLLLSYSSLYAGDRFAGIHPRQSSQHRAPGLPPTGGPAEYDESPTPTECNTDRYMSQFLLRTLMPNSHQLKVEFSNAQKTHINVVLPPYYTLCLGEITLENTLVDNNLHFRVKMEKTFTEYNQCLKNGNHIDENGEPTNTASFEQTISRQKTFPINVSNFDRKKNMSVIFESPKPGLRNGNYPSYFHEGPTTGTDLPAAPDNCFQSENIVSGRKPFQLYTSPENLAAQSAYAACISGDYRRILGELSNLDRNSVGNADELRRILDESLRLARDEKAQEIYRRLESINDLFAPGENGELEVSEGQAKDLASEYRNLMTELDQVLLEPSKNKLLELIERRAEHLRIDPEYKVILEEQIERLNESVGVYAKENHLHLYRGLQKYGLAKRAKDIESVRLKSKAYSSLGSGSTGEDAERFIERELHRRESVFNEWELAYRAGSGDASVVRQQERIFQRSRQRISRDFGRFQRRETDRMQRYCGRNFIGGVKNPAGCRRFMANRRQRGNRATSRRAENIQQATRDEMRLQRYRDLYERNRERTLDDWVSDEPYGFYDYDDNSTDLDSFYNMGPPPQPNHLMMPPMMQQQPNHLMMPPMMQQQNHLMMPPMMQQQNHLMMPPMMMQQQNHLMMPPMMQQPNYYR